MRQYEGDAVDVVVLSQCRKELDEFPSKVKEDLLDVLRDLHAGLNLSMPLSKKMSGLGEGVYELRFREVSGIYRVIYLIKKNDAIYLVHAFKKKTNKTPRKDIEVAQQRIKRIT